MTMPAIQPSRSLVEAYATLLRHPRWISNRELGEMLPTINARTIRSVTSRLRDANLVEERRVHHGFMFRALDPSPHILDELRAAAEVFGIDIPSPNGTCPATPSIEMNAHDTTQCQPATELSGRRTSPQRPRSGCAAQGLEADAFQVG